MLKKLKFKKMDAFTDGQSAGNPAGYVWMAADDLLNEKEMLQVARELKGFVSEVGFAYQSGPQLFLRYFSSEEEVAFCGHATIAILYDLLKNNPPENQKGQVTIHVRAGELVVIDQIREENAVYIMAPDAIYLGCRLNPEQVALVLEISPDEINANLPLRIINGGLRTLLVPVTTLEVCLRINPNQERLRLFCIENEIDIIHVFVKETWSADCQYRTRVFAPRFGYLEDPATGSGNAAFGYYLLEQNCWPGDFTLEQGFHKTNPNFVKLKRINQQGKDRIQFSGCAITRMDGEYYLFSSDDTDV